MLNCRGKRAQIKSLHMRVLPKLVTLVPYECGLISPHTVAGIRVFELGVVELGAQHISFNDTATDSDSNLS